MPYRYNKNSNLGILNFGKNTIITHDIAIHPSDWLQALYRAARDLYRQQDFFYPPINQRSDRFTYLL